MARTATPRLARALRRNAPVTERLLWRVLRDRKLAGLKFRRQVPMGAYVLDFVCYRHRLVVEADGPFHDTGRDAIRDAWLRRCGFTVLRFTNSEIHAADYRVANRILLAINRAGPVGDF